MTNSTVVAEFFRAYQAHHAARMHACLDREVVFTDLAFDRINGDRVRAMWRWFTVATESRKGPVEVPEFEILREVGEAVEARYRVHYDLDGGKRTVDYWIRAVLTLRGGRIVLHEDTPEISPAQFARMALPPALAWLGQTPLLKPFLRWMMRRRLDAFLDAKKTTAQGRSAGAGR